MRPRAENGLVQLGRFSIELTPDRWVADLVFESIYRFDGFGNSSQKPGAVFAFFSGSSHLRKRFRNVKLDFQKSYEIILASLAQLGEVHT